MGVRGCAGQKQRGRDGRIYAKEVVGRRKWVPWWSPIKWPVEGLAAIYLGQPAVLASERGRERRLRGTLEPWEPGPSSCREGREGTRQRGAGVGKACSRVVQGYRGITVCTLRLPVSPSTCQRAIPPTADPHTVPPYTYCHINVCAGRPTKYISCAICMQYVF